jgi:predicted NAD/FAD-dependent oxidoreductase
MRIGIVGAGMAGLACAESLANAGHDVVLWDKGRAPGGRMSTRRVPTSLGEAEFDFGAQYFTVRDPGFRRRVDQWIAGGAVAPWLPAGSDAHIGVPAMNTPLRQMAALRRVHWSTRITRIDSLGPGWRLHTDDGAIEVTGSVVEGLVVALPAEQAAALLAMVAPDDAARATATRSLPCWSAMVAFAAPVAAGLNHLRGEGIISVASRNNSKAGRTGPECWVIHASPEWSTRHLEAEPDWITQTLVLALAELLRIRLPPVVAAASHRWRFARSGSDGSGSIWDPLRRLGVCGDWLIGPRIEAAWMSGTALAARIAESLP